MRLNFTENDSHAFYSDLRYLGLPETPSIRRCVECLGRGLRQCRRKGTAQVRRKWFAQLPRMSEYRNETRCLPKKIPVRQKKETGGDVVPIFPGLCMCPGMMPILQPRGLITPGQLGPTSRDLDWLFKALMTCMIEACSR